MSVYNNKNKTIYLFSKQTYFAFFHYYTEDTNKCEEKWTLKIPQFFSDVKLNSFYISKLDRANSKKIRKRNFYDRNTVV